MRKFEMIKYIKKELEVITETSEEFSLEDYYRFLEQFNHKLFNNPPMELR